MLSSTLRFDLPEVFQGELHHLVSPFQVPPTYVVPLTTGLFLWLSLPLTSAKCDATWAVFIAARALESNYCVP